MNNFTEHQRFFGGSFAALIASLLLLSACATGPASPEGSLEAREKLTALQNDSELAGHARSEIREAEQAVQLAEKPLPASDGTLASHRVYMADHKVEIARAKATTRLAEAQRATLDEQRGDARLRARTREADKAHADAARARSSEAEMKKRLDDLEAKPTERGMVVTLGDVLFDTGSSDLRDSAGKNLDKLASFLGQYPDHRLLIEGHTDNVGSSDYNQRLSLMRAESVKQYLTGKGIRSQRLSVSGMGMQNPIAANSTAAGRQQNRRVEIVIEPPPYVSSTTTRM